MIRAIPRALSSGTIKNDPKRAVRVEIKLSNRAGKLVRH